MSDEETPGIILYSRSTSSASYRVRIALNLKRQQYDIKAMDLEQQHHKSGEYLSLNPQGLVPLLCHQLDTGEVKLSQSVAIIEYLEDTFPKQGASLLPTDAIGRARVRSLALHIACEMQPLNNSGVVNFIKTDLKGDADTLKRWQLHWAEKGFMGLEVQLESKSTGKFCHGDSPTLADCCLVPQVSLSCIYLGYTLVQTHKRYTAVPAHVIAIKDYQLTVSWHSNYASYISTLLTIDLVHASPESAV